MSQSLLRPDFKADIAGLAKRISNLERRLAPQPAAHPAAGHVHDGLGDESVILSGDTQGHEPSADGYAGVGIGESANAAGDYAVAIGFTADVQGDSAVGIGETALATATNAVAIGSSSSATDIDATAIGSDAAASFVAATAIGANSSAHQNSVALGYDVSTTDTDQVNLGTRQLVFGGPPWVTSSGDMINGQISFYLNEAGNTLGVKVKYSNGTVKTGTVALV